jgi:hypothetical protein
VVLQLYFHAQFCLWTEPVVHSSWLTYAHGCLVHTLHCGGAVVLAAEGNSHSKPCAREVPGLGCVVLGFFGVSVGF